MKKQNKKRTSTKEYGKLTASQLKQVVEALPEARQEQSKFEEALRSDPDKLNEYLSDGSSWAWVYEFSLTQHLALLAIIAGQEQFITVTAAAEDPEQVLLDTMGDDDWEIPPERLPAFLPTFVALTRTFVSISIHQKSLSELVAEVRQGNDESLFNAVRIDPSIVSNPTIANRISRATVLDDKVFFGKLAKALKGVSGKHWKNYRDFRYLTAMLHSMGVKDLSEKKLEELIVHELKLYPNTSSSSRNIREQYLRTKKINPLK